MLAHFVKGTHRHTQTQPAEAFGYVLHREFEMITGASNYLASLAASIIRSVEMSHRFSM